MKDEKGPGAAKTYMVVLHCVLLRPKSNMIRVKGLLNVFGIYNYTNDRMLHTPVILETREKYEFIIFIERVDSFYYLNIKTDLDQTMHP